MCSEGQRSKSQSSNNATEMHLDWALLKVSWRCVPSFDQQHCADCASTEMYLARGPEKRWQLGELFYIKPSGLTSATGHAKDFKAKG